MAGIKKGSDPSRAERKAKRRQLEDAIPDVPGDNELTEEPQIASRTEKSSKKRKREHQADTEENELTNGKQGRKEKGAKNNKKRRNEEGGVALNGDIVEEVVLKKKSGAEADNVLESSETPRKSKKERKAERKAREAAEAAANNADRVPAVTSNTGSEDTGGPIAPTAKGKKAKKNKQNQERNGKDTTGTKDTTNGDKEKTEGRAARFIVFIGNISSNAVRNIFTDSSFRQSTIHSNDNIYPKAFCHRETNICAKSNAKRRPYQIQRVRILRIRRLRPHEDLLKAIPPLQFRRRDLPAPENQRRAHVCFLSPLHVCYVLMVDSAGGGGNTKDRKMKIKAKNEKLNEERVRRIQEEAKTKAAKNEGAIDESAIHPSRRTRVPGA
jgi:nucleolar protein 6